MLIQTIKDERHEANKERDELLALHKKLYDELENERNMRRSNEKTFNDKLGQIDCTFQNFAEKINNVTVIANQIQRESRNQSSETNKILEKIEVTPN